MDRQDAIEYIANVSWRESRLGLTRIEALLRAMGSPEKKLRFVHVAGTNGKGSVCTMLASVLAAAGYKTGAFTSPFVNRFNERMQVNGEQITDEELTQLTAEVRRHADEMEDHPTEFELVTAIGFLYFLRKQCDLVVLEVGLGGRLDATNVIPPPVLAVITSIGRDHVEELGKDIRQIAAEKAGIIKPGSAVVSAPQQPQVETVLEEACRRQGAPLHKVEAGRLRAGSTRLGGQHFTWDGTLELELPLSGAFQLPNAATALTAIEVLGSKGYRIEPDAIQRGMAKVHWPARLELLCKKPVFLLDGGHNLHAVEALAASLASFYPGQKWTLLTGVMADKEWQDMMRAMLPLAERFFCVTPDSPRALPAQQLAEGIRQMEGPSAEVCTGVQAGVEKALAAAGEEGLVCAFGSLYMAGEIRNCFGLGGRHEQDVL